MSADEPSPLPLVVDVAVAGRNGRRILPVPSAIRRVPSNAQTAKLSVGVVCTYLELCGGALYATVETVCSSGKGEGWV